MKKIILSNILLIALTVGALHAQDIVGTWQGTRQGAQKEFRVIFKITKADNGDLKAMYYSIDQNGHGFPTGAITIQGESVKFEIPGFDGAYEGKLSGDRSSIVGKWILANGVSSSLNLKHVAADAAWAISAPPGSLKPMPAGANPSFEIATIKPSSPDQQGVSFGHNGRRFSTKNTSLNYLIATAYELQQKQILAAPAWAETDKYNIEAQSDTEGFPSVKQENLMVQKLLADRFKLTLHYEKKEFSVYSLVFEKPSHELTKSEDDPSGGPEFSFQGSGKLIVTNSTMTEFVQMLQSTILDRPVVDQTGLTGRYDFILTWTPDESQFTRSGINVPRPIDSAAAPPNLFTAIQEQMGMKLHAAKAPVNVLVIDHVEKPSAN